MPESMLENERICEIIIACCVFSAEEVEKYAKKMLGNTLVTKQTGPAGQVCAKVLINEGIKIEKEMYFAILMDRSVGGPCMVASTEGGMDIEEVAKKNPKVCVVC